MTFTENVSLQENGVCHCSEMEEAWNNQGFSHRWLSDQSEHSEERSHEINPVKLHKTCEVKNSHTVSIMFGGNQVLHFACTIPMVELSGGSLLLETAGTVKLRGS